MPARFTSPLAGRIVGAVFAFVAAGCAREPAAAPPPRAVAVPVAATVDASAAPPPTVDASPEASPVAEVVADAAPPSPTRSEKLMQCCNALGARAKTLGATPEALWMSALAWHCSMLAGQPHPSLESIRAELVKSQVPACQLRLTDP